MLPISRGSKNRILLFLGIYLLGGLTSLLTSGVPFTILSGLIYGIGVVAWLLTIRRRVLYRKTRRCLVLIGWTMLLLFLLRNAKYSLFDELLEYGHLLWYGYYIAFIFIPILDLCAAVSITPEQAGQMPRVKLLFIPAGILLLFVMTNDYHELAFRFLTDELRIYAPYRHGPVYVCIVVWNILLFVASLATIFRKSRISRVRQCTWIPLFVLLSGGAYFVYLSFRESTSMVIPVPHIYRLPEAYCFMTICYWESCIQIGLVQTNTDYERLMAVSGFDTMFLNADGSEASGFRSGRKPRPEEKEIREALAGPVPLDPDTLLYCANVRGGNILWTEDIRMVNRLNEKLSEVQERLREENTLLQAENEWKQQQIQLEEQNRIYDRIGVLLRPEVRRIQELIREAAAVRESAPEQFRSCLARAAVLGAYFKRRANLALLSEERTEISLDELYLSMRESLEYLRLLDIAAGIAEESGRPERLVPAEQVVFCYDGFERMLEYFLEEMVAVQVRIGADAAGWKVRTVIDSLLEKDTPAGRAFRRPAALSALLWRFWPLDKAEEAGCSCTLYREDESIYAELAFRELPRDRARKGGAA